MGEKKAIRAAIYARVSKSEQDPEPQLQALREYVKQRGFVLHKEYVDRVTGDFAKRKKKRRQQDQAYQELMDDVNKRLVDCVIVWKFDRFARSLNVLITALEQFNSLGVDFISYTQSIDTTTAMGRLFYNIIGSFAEFEKEMIVERVNAGLANAKSKGVQLGRPVRDKTAASRIATLRQEGWSLRMIAKREKLSAAGVLKILRRNESSISESKIETSLVEAVEPTAHKPAIKLMLATNKAQPAKDNPEIYQFKIVIMGVTPVIWRRIQIRSDCKLADLSDVIVAAFDWGGYHLHKFFLPHSWGEELEESGESKKLNALGLRPDDCIMYEYDFGDCWGHEIIFEKAVRFDKKRTYPTCTAGKNAGPPEDCGGPGAYMNARNFLSRRKGKKAKAPRGRVSAFEKEFYRENYKGFDPDKFDRAEVNEQLAELFKEK
jgi:DNA invertase Pin-like site-specific DNA recombinase